MADKIHTTVMWLEDTEEHEVIPAPADGKVIMPLTMTCKNVTGNSQATLDVFLKETPGEPLNDEEDYSIDTVAIDAGDKWALDRDRKVAIASTAIALYVQLSAEPTTKIPFTVSWLERTNG